jgi:hypothetical protein
MAKREHKADRAHKAKKVPKDYVRRPWGKHPDDTDAVTHSPLTPPSGQEGRDPEEPIK